MSSDAPDQESTVAIPPVPPRPLPPVPREADDRHRVTVAGREFCLREMSGYEMMKIGRTAKGAEEDVIVEWIVACAIEPTITREEARNLPAKEWYGLLAEIERIHGLDGNFQRTVSGSG